MKTRDETRQLRRYVLGSATEPETEAIEREYFERADALDRVIDAEDDLIEDYLSDRLSRGERELFERHYLSTSSHRARVEILRAVRHAGATQAGRRRPTAAAWWTRAGMAAALVIGVASALWIVVPESTPPEGPAGSVRESTQPTSIPPPPERSTPARPAPGEPASDPRTPVTIALSVSPILVRGADVQPATVTIASGIDVVRLHLVGQTGDPPLRRGRVIVRTVVGREVWRGAAVEGTNSDRDLGLVDVPAALLEPDDYVVALLDSPPGTEEVERHRYFLRVRGR